MDILQTLVEETPDAIIATSPEGAVLYWNAGAEQTFGYSREEATGHPLTDLIIPSDRLAEDAKLTAEALAGGVATFETLRCRKNGSLVHVNVSTRAVRDADGR